MFIAEKNCSSASPVISTGNTSGDSSSASTTDRPGTSNRTSANAAGMPNATEVAVTASASASQMLSVAASWKSGSASTCAYQSKVKPCGGNVANGAAENEIDTATSSGASTNSMVPPVIPYTSQAVPPDSRPITPTSVSRAAPASAAPAGIRTARSPRTSARPSRRRSPS